MVLNKKYYAFCMSPLILFVNYSHFLCVNFWAQLQLTLKLACSATHQTSGLCLTCRQQGGGAVKGHAGHRHIVDGPPRPSALFLLPVPLLQEQSPAGGHQHLQRNNSRQLSLRHPETPDSPITDHWMSSPHHQDWERTRWCPPDHPAQRKQKAIMQSFLQ